MPTKRRSRLTCMTMPPTRRLPNRWPRVVQPGSPAPASSTLPSRMTFRQCPRVPLLRPSATGSVRVTRPPRLSRALSWPPPRQMRIAMPPAQAARPGPNGRPVCARHRNSLTKPRVRNRPVPPRRRCAGWQAWSLHPRFRVASGPRSRLLQQPPPPMAARQAPQPPRPVHNPALAPAPCPCAASRATLA